MKESEVKKTFEKIDMIDSDKLTELLSSKKKHRYQPVQDSMDGVVDVNIHQQINFTDEEENLQIPDYCSPGVSTPVKQESHDIDNIVEDVESTVREQRKEPEVEDIQPEKEFIMESMTYQQIREEQENLIEDANLESENQTVINCTQSDEEISEGPIEERLSDKNAIIDENSLENAKGEVDEPHLLENYHQGIQFTEEDEYKEENRQKVFVYPEETYESSEGECEQEETSRIEFPIDPNHSEPNYYPDSNESYSDDLMQEVEADSLLDDQASQKEKDYFEKTLTNMRLAFGSEQHIRENSVKTLEQIDHSQKDSGSGNKTEEKSSIFEKKSFQDFSLKKFTELMNVKNMKNFKDSMQKTFREYNKTKILSASEKKSHKNRKSSTPKKSS